MSVTVSQLVGLVEIRGIDQGVAGLARMGVATDLTSKQLGLLGVGAGVVAAGALVVLGLKTAQMAGNFEQGINRLKTGGGDIQDTFNSLGNAIKKVAVDSGVATGPLINAMYQIVSANQRGAQAYQTLAAAAQGAQIEQANVVDVTKVLTTLQTNWGLKTFTATQYMNGLVSAVSQGKLTLEQLSTAMSPILPIAAQMGISFKDVSAAMAVQTNAGLDANRAATGLQAVFVNIENPTHKAAAAMKLFGVNSVAVADEMKKSLPGAFQMLMDAALKVGPIGSVAFNRAMADMVGGGTRTAKTIDALTQHMSDWTGGVAKIGDAMKSSNKDVNGWALAQSGFNIQMDKAKAALEVLGITIGQALLPALTKIVSAITPVIVAVTNWLVKNQMILPILGIMAAVIGGILVTSLISLVAASWPAIAVIAGIIAVVAVVILAVKNWGAIVSWLGGLWHTVSGWIGDRFNWLGTTVHNIITGIEGWFNNLAGVFKALLVVAVAIFLPIVALIGGVILVVTRWGSIMQWFANVWHTVSQWVGDRFNWLGTVARSIVDGIIRWFQQLPGALLNIGVQMIQGLINGIWSMAGNFASALGNMVHNAVGNIPGLGGILSGLHILGYEQGGPVLQTGLAMVHKGEYVVPAGGFPSSRMPSSSGYGAGGMTQVNLQINGYTLARLLMPHIVANIRNNVGVTNI